MQSGRIGGVDNLENGNQTDIIVMDFSKAFDKVDHNKLIYTN